MNITRPTSARTRLNPNYDYQFRIAGLNDIDQRVELMYVRNPVPGNPQNIPNPANATIFGRRANVPDDEQLSVLSRHIVARSDVHRSAHAAESYTVYPYNLQSPQSWSIRSSENAMGYLMRNTQWMIQTLGVDGFRIDTAKHVYPFVLDYYDRGVFRQDLRTNLDGSQRNVFAFLEYLDGNRAHGELGHPQGHHERLEHGRRQSRCAGFPAVLRDARQPDEHWREQQLAPDPACQLGSAG